MEEQGSVKVFFRDWVEKVREFQSLPEEEQDKFCSFCGCEGGCNLCTNLDELLFIEIDEF
jgi:hypothetical protein